MTPVWIIKFKMLKYSKFSRTTHLAIICAAFVLTTFIFLQPKDAIQHNAKITYSSNDEERKAYTHNDPDVINFKPLGEADNENGTSGSSTFYETLRLNTKHLSATFILIVTYGRSGSSWLGAMTSQAKNTFYVFEPLQKAVSTGYYRENLICFSNNTCRQPTRLLERHTTILTTIHKLFTCQMSKLHPVFKNILKRNIRSEKPKLALRKCLKSSSLNQCVKKMENICAKSTHRILKTIRVQMELVGILMRLWPNLKVVHLIRDPRAVTSSRLRSVDFSMAQNVIPHSQYLCSVIYKNVLWNMALQKSYPNRLKIVLYEALTARPLDGAKYIYQFLAMSFTDTIFQWVHNTTHANKNTRNQYYGILRSNVEEVAVSWREKMDLLKVQVIDYFCKDLYTVLGFVPMNSTKELKSLAVPSRRNITIDGFV